MSARFGMHEDKGTFGCLCFFAQVNGTVTPYLLFPNAVSGAVLLLAVVLGIGGWVVWMLMRYGAP
jgi:hypothetical protein